VLSKFRAVLLLTVIALPLHAQTMRDRVIGLFKFGVGCDDPVCLSVGNAHKEHFNPAARTGQANLIDFVSDAIAASTSSIPISAASSGATWSTSSSGLFVRSQTSAGPVFAERAQTIGRGHVLFGANFSSYAFQSLRGVPLSNLEFNFTHQVIGPKPLGQNADYENDIIEVRSDVSVNLFAATAFATIGIAHNLDVSVAVPYVRTSIDGSSIATVYPFTNPTPHYFGPADNPSLTATAGSVGSASGIGDVAVRVKAVLGQSGRVSFALLGDARLPTGNVDNFLGAGKLSLRGQAIASASYGNFSPHINVGYWLKSNDTENDAVLATLGFDQLLGGRVTFAADVISEWQTGASKLVQPDPVVEVTPIGPNYVSDRTIYPSNIPQQRDNEMLATVGFKFSTMSGVSVVTNVLVPMLRGGLQPNTAFMLGVEYSF
jgi:hypothetical protein